MKNFKQFALATLIAIAGSTTVFMTSCSKEDDTCAVGYEGSDCKTLSRDKFVGVYAGHENCTLGTDDYTITIASNSDAIKLTMTNLYNASYTAVGSMTGSNTFTFSGTQSGATFTGSGTLSGNQLTVTYQISDGSISNSCTFVGNK